MSSTQTQDAQASVVIEPLSHLTEEDMQAHQRFVQVARDVGLPANFRVVIGRDGAGGRFFYQIEADRIDVVTCQIGVGRGGPAYLDPAMSESSLVQTIFGLYDAYCHHEARETFTWRGRRVFGPHIDIEAHWEVAERFVAPTVAST